MNTNKWGGKRTGSGRKKELSADARTRSIIVTDEEFGKVKEYISQLRIFNYDYGVPGDCRFVKVTGEDGIFYDLVKTIDSKHHIEALGNEGYAAVIVNKTTVPACRFRDFTDGLQKYRDASIKNGTEFYF